MRKILTVPLLLLGLLCISNLAKPEKNYPHLPPPTQNDSLETLLENAFLYRMRLMEEKSGMKFEDGWVPKVNFGRPDYVSNLAEFGASYDHETKEFWITKSFKAYYYIPNSLDSMQYLSKGAKGIIDHELGHALADQISRRHNGFMWPDIYAWVNQTDVEKYVAHVLTEGVGEYFEHLMSSDTLDTSTSSEWLPDGPSSWAWTQDTWAYNGGYFIVKPIIDKFGEKGILYISTHTFSYKDGDMRSAGIEYQKNALLELSK